ncbi:TonB family protein [Tolypothrix sp. VBCCA 56010]|uniref:TonB family protein n=1 Tax=Tolypothrix sp. VBCCA 56010 TaxID=3137731 RepID=UPI003D7E76FC
MKHRLFNSLSFGASLLILFAQPAKAQITQITGIKYKLTERGLELILVTPIPKTLLSFPRRQGNTQIFNISNTQLSLPCSNNFRRNKPVPGIQFISVTPQNNNGISIAVRGEKSLPKLLVFISQAKIDCIKCSFQYPEELRKKGIEGRADVVLDIDEQGNVTKMSLRSYSGNTQLDNAILTQVRDMKFTASACGETNLILRANFLIQGSEFHRQLIEEYRIRGRQEHLREKLRNGAQ